MSTFVRRRARALTLEAEHFAETERWAEAVERLCVARELLRREADSAGADLPLVLRKLGELAAKAGDDKLSDESYLEARRLEQMGPWKRPSGH